MTEVSPRKKLRDRWMFAYKAGEVAAAVEEKITHHTGRLDEYRERRDEVQDELEDRGVSLTVRHHSGGADVKATADSDLAEEFNHLQNKVEKHEDKLEEYRRWRRILKGNESKELKLTAADVEFFGL